MTITTDQLTKNLVKSIRKGHKQHNQKIQIVLDEQKNSHSWHFGVCLDCGIKSSEALSDTCDKKK